MIRQFFSVLQATRQQNLLPATTETPLLANFNSWKYGIFICYGMPTYKGEDRYGTNKNHPVSAPTVFAPPADIDTKIRSWVDFAADDCGADYAIFTVSHQLGFGMYPFQTRYNNGVPHSATDQSRGTVTHPQYDYYNVTSPLYTTPPSQTMVHSFCEQCEIKGIDAVLYYNIGKQLNNKGGHDLPEAAFDDSGNYVDWYNIFYAQGYAAANAAYPTWTGTYAQHYRKYQDYVKAQIVELVSDSSLNFNYMWLDAPMFAPRGFLQELYTAVKSVRQDVILIYNYMTIPSPGAGSFLPEGNFPGFPPYDFNGDMYLFPIDIASFEQFRKPDDDNETTTILSPYKGKDYWIPKEIVHNSGQYWYYRDGMTFDGPNGLQADYNQAKFLGCPYALSLSPDLDGIIPTTQADRLSGIIL